MCRALARSCVCLVPKHGALVSPNEPNAITAKDILVIEDDAILREALSELTGRFVPVTDACYWSDSLGEPKATASFVAFNHARAHVLASHTTQDLWQGLTKP